jgi:hypothetical protein
MMINNKHVWIYLLLTIFALSPLFVLGYLNHQKNNFSCQSEIVISKGNSVYSALMYYHFDNGNGIVETSGYFKKEGAAITKINKRIAFRYWVNDDTLTMVSSYLHNDNVTDASLNALTPDFFLYSDRGVTYQLAKENKSTYLFIQSDTPLFSCVINPVKHPG